MNRHLTTLALLAAALSAPYSAHASVSDEYARSLALYRTAHYTEARAAFQQVLTHNPSGDYADNALYWIGETFYAEGNYTSALNAFRQVVTLHPSEPKAPDALFKIALCNLQLGRTDGYRNTLRGLGARYPDAEISMRAAHMLRQVEERAPTAAEEPSPHPVIFPRGTDSASTIGATQQLFVDDDGMGVSLPPPPSAETLRAIRRELERERESLEKASEDELSVGEVLFSVVAPGGLLYMAHRNSERQHAEEELKSIDQDFALVDAEARRRTEQSPMIASAP